MTQDFASHIQKSQIMTCGVHWGWYFAKRKHNMPNGRREWHIFNNHKEEFLYNKMFY